MNNFLNLLFTNQGFRVLLVVIVLDTIFGILRAIKERKVNSCIGIDGMIRKAGMIFAIIFLVAIDSLIGVNFIGFIPTELKDIIGIQRIGISELFTFLFIVFETLSIFKNMILCKLPIPKKLQIYLEKIMKEFTSEIKDDKVTVIEAKNVEIRKEGEVK